MHMDLTSLTLVETADALEKGETTALAVTQAYLDRIDQLNPKLNAYLTIFRDTALEQAKASDERRAASGRLSILDGIPFAIKDNFSTEGQRTTAGSNILENYLPAYDATAIRKLKELGAVILGKTNMDQFAMGSSTESSAFDDTHNPWDTSRVPGGSSGGSAAAVAANLCAAALGSDTAGSIRQPAGFCSIVGLKPTYGLISRYGLLAMASSLDVVGPMTKTVEDSQIILEALRGQDQYDGTTLSTENLPESKVTGTDLTGLKVGVPKEYFGEGMNPENETVVRAAIAELEKLGAEIVEVSLPTSPLCIAAYYILCPVEVASNMARYDGIRYGESLEREAGDHSLIDVYKKSRSKHLGAEVKRRIMLGTYASSAGYYDAYYNKAMKVRALIKKELDEVFTQVDILATPISPSVPFKLGEKSSDPLAMYMEDIDTVPINLAGVPALALPCGFVSAEGHQLPVGLQLIGPRLGEETLLAVGKAYEAATAWHTKKPVLEV